MNPQKEFEKEITLLLLEKEGRVEPSELQGYEEGYELGFHKSFKRLSRSTRNAIKNPGRAIKRRVKRIVKVAKKVAPYAAAGAALYFGAPYALQAAGFLKAKAGVAMAMASGFMGGGGQGPMGPPAPEMGPPLPEGFIPPSSGFNVSSMISPQVLSFAGKMAASAMAKQGVRVRSPQAKRAVQQYVNAEAYRAERAVSPGTDYTKFLIPAGAAVGAILLLKG